MSSVQILSNRCFEDLINEKDPFKSIFNLLLDKWSIDIRPSRSFDENLQRVRQETFEFEKLLAERKNGIFPSVYDNLIKNCIAKSGQIITETLQHSNACLVLMDALSIREAGFIKHLFSKNSTTRLKFRHTYSSLPSDTIHFEKGAINDFLRNFSNKERIRNSSDIDRISPKYPLLVQSPFPDIFYHSHSAGYTTILPLNEIFSKTIKLFQKMIRIIKSFRSYDKIIITSDHGYFDRRAGSFKLKQDQISLIKRVFGGRRYASDTQITRSLENLITDKVLYKFENHLIINGTFSWPVRGSFSQFVHGGISLMECLIPIISIDGG